MSASSRPDPLADRGQAHGEVDRRGRLADPALARRHGDDRLHARDQRAVGPCGGRRAAPSVGGGPGARRGAAPARARRSARRCRRARRAGAHRLLAGRAHRLEGRRLGRVDLDREADIAALDDHAGDHAEADHVLALRRGWPTRRSAASTCSLVISFMVEPSTPLRRYTRQQSGARDPWSCGSLLI